MLKRLLTSRWKWLLAGLVVIITLGVGLTAWRVTSFVSATTGGGRTGGYLSSTPDPTFSVTPAQTLRAEAAGTPQSLDAVATPLSLPTPTPAYANSTLVQKIKNGQPITLMLAGYGGDGHAGQWLTDTVLLLRFDPKTKTLVELNVPRDLYVFIPYGGKNKGRWDKLNTALPTVMEWGDDSQSAFDPRYRWSNKQEQFDRGVNLLADTVELVTGWPVDYWATLSFEGFRRFIDALGGVDVNVQHYFIDYKYPRNDNDQIDASYKTVEFDAGPQRMNGEKAIEYARSRYSETPGEQGDFARSQRQMNLINAVKTQVLKQNLITKSLDYMEALQGQLRFSLDFGELVALANYFNSDEGKTLANAVRLYPAVLNDTLLVNKTLGDSYILLPRDGQGQYDSLQRWLRFEVLDSQYPTVATRVQVLNGNGRAGLAGKLTDFLVDKGFAMKEEMDGENREDTVVFDYSSGQAQSTIDQLKAVLPDLKVLPTPASERPKNAPPDVQLQVCIGKDFSMTRVANGAKP